MANRYTVGIVGAGLAGLSCAYYLEKLGYDPVIFEKNSYVGGRCSSEKQDGYILDRGFQILLTSYTEVKKIIRLHELEIEKFPPEVKVLYQSHWHEFANPLRKPLSIFNLRQIPFAYFSDIVKLGSLYLRSAYKIQEPFFRSTSSPTFQFIKDQGFSDEFTQAILKPFFGGVFLDKNLATNHDIFLWLLRLFVEGSASLPKNGMGAIAEQLAKKLTKTKIHFENKVTAIEGRKIFTDGRDEHAFDKIVVALPASPARLLFPFLPEIKSRKTCTLYFSIDKKSFKFLPSSALHINGTGKGAINSVAFNSLVQPSYAPAGKVLAAVSIIDQDWIDKPELVSTATDQFSKWFKLPIESIKLIKEYRIEEALPNQETPPPLQWHYSLDRQPDVYLCGEYVDNASINGAIASGRKVADVVHQGLTRLQELKEN